MQWAPLDLFFYTDLINIFDETFYSSTNTRLEKGADEPVYLPVDEQCEYNRIIFAHGYYASALHEIAHWCIAGNQRRKLQDYGYWYCPDGRNQTQQQEFEQVEVKPQAIEWAFCLATGHKFNVSTDNLNGFQADTQAFTAKVTSQLKCYQQNGFPERAQHFIDALCYFYEPQTNPLRQNETI